MHATVRDASRADKVDFLHAMGGASPGNLKLFEADLTESQNGSYDAAFSGCAAVFHVAADQK